MNKQVKKELVFEILIFCAMTVLIPIFYRNNILLACLLIILWGLGIKFWHNRGDILFFVTMAIVGSVGEIMYIHFGVWKYANPTFLGLPLYIPFFWGLTIV